MVKTRLKDLYFWATLLVILGTICLMVATYLRWFRLNFFVGPFRYTHWLSWIGTLFIAFFTPVYYVLKRRYARKAKALLGTHVVGNLLAFMLISIHFAQQIGRSPQFYPELGTGLILYIVMIIMVATGVLQRFQIVKSLGRYWRFIHRSVVISFYLIIITHILHGLNIL